MPGTLIGVTYSSANVALSILDVTMDADDTAIQTAISHLPTGHKMATIAAALLPLFNGRHDTRIETLIAAIAAAGGPTIQPPQRTAVVDATGAVVDVVMACATTLNASPAVKMRLVLAAGGKAVGPNAVSTMAHDQAGIGWRLAAGKLVNPAAVTAAQIAAAAVPGPLGHSYTLHPDGTWTLNAVAVG